MINTKYVEFHPFDNMPCQPVIMVSDPMLVGECSIVKNRKQDEDVSEVTPVVGYNGMMAINDIYDYVEDGVLHQLVGRVDLGSLDWQIGTTYTYFIAKIIGIKSSTADYSTPILCKKYPNGGFAYDSQIKTKPHNVFYTKTNAIRIIPDDYTTPEEFKSAMSGVYLYYELSKEITTEIGSIKTLPCEKIYIEPTNANLGLGFDGYEFEQEDENDSKIW